METAAGCKVLSSAIGAIFELLGLDVYSREGDKAYPFCREFDVLGVTFNLVGVPNGSCIVANKKSRVEKFVNMLKSAFLIVAVLVMLRPASFMA